MESPKSKNVSTEEASVALLQSIVQYVQTVGTNNRQAEQQFQQIEARLDQITGLLTHQHPTPPAPTPSVVSESQVVPSSTPVVPPPIAPSTSTPSTPTVPSPTTTIAPPTTTVPPPIAPSAPPKETSSISEASTTETEDTPISQQDEHMDDLQVEPETTKGFLGGVHDPFLAGVELIGVLVAMVAVALGLTTLYIDPSDSEQAGLVAVLNAETTRFINNVDMYKHYRIYTTHALNSELQNQLENDLAVNSDEEPELQRELAQVSNEIAASQRFFPVRYLNRDGSYNKERELGESWAQASQTMDLNPQPHFDQADDLRIRYTQLMLLFVLITFAITFCDIGEALHKTRKYLRRLALATIITFTIMTVVGMVQIMWG